MSTYLLHASLMWCSILTCKQKVRVCKRSRLVILVNLTVVPVLAQTYTVAPFCVKPRICSLMLSLCVRVVHYFVSNFFFIMVVLA